MQLGTQLTITSKETVLLLPGGIVASNEPSINTLTLTEQAFLVVKEMFETGSSTGDRFIEAFPPTIVVAVELFPRTKGSDHNADSQAIT